MDRLDTAGLRRRLEIEKLRERLEAERKPTPTSEDSSMGSAASLGLGSLQGITAGFGDELAGVGGAVMEGFRPGAYTEARDFSRNLNKQAAENPIAYGAGNIGGSLLAAPLAGAAGGTIKGAAGLGALAGLGQGEGDLTKGEIGQAALETGLGAAIGAGAGAAMKAAPAAIENANRLTGPAGDAVRRMAERIAGKFGGAKSVELRDPEEVERIGRYLLDKVIKNPVTHPLSQSTESALGRVQALNKAAGQKMGEAYQAVDAQGNFINPGELAEQFKTQYMTPLRRETGASLDPQVTALMSRPNIGDPNKRISSQAMGSLKGEVGDMAKFDVQSKYPPDVREQAAQAYGFLSDKIDEVVGSKLGDEALGAFQGAKKDYGMTAEIEPMLRKKLGLELNRSPLSGVDVMAGAAGDVKGLALKKGLGFLQPGAGTAFMADKVGHLLQSSPQVFGKFAEPLQSAAAKGGNALAITNFVLHQTQPEYQEIFKNLDEMPNE